jgi:hypothetical protein
MPPRFRSPGDVSAKALLIGKLSSKLTDNNTNNVNELLRK